MTLYLVLSVLYFANSTFGAWGWVMAGKPTVVQVFILIFNMVMAASGCILLLQGWL